MKNDAYLNVRLNNDLLNNIKKVAKMQERSLSQVARKMIIGGFNELQVKYDYNDLKRLFIDNNLKDYIKVHYDYYSKQNIATMLYQVLDALDELWLDYSYSNIDNAKNKFNALVLEDK